MPGYELIGREEFNEIKHLFDESGILFRHSFDHLRNNIYKVKEFEKAFAKRMRVPFALGVTSGTSALRIALAALDIKEGDEVIAQSFTFVATVEAIIESRAIPVITEIDKTLNMDPVDLEKKITDKTKAIIVVHMLGVPARLKEIKEITDKHGIPLIEDTAWGCGGYYDDIPLGTYGEIGTYSFDFAKTMTTGEGGMLVFKDKNLYDKAKTAKDREVVSVVMEISYGLIEQIEHMQKCVDEYNLYNNTDGVYCESFRFTHKPNEGLLFDAGLAIGSEVERLSNLYEDSSNKPIWFKDFIEGTNRNLELLDEHGRLNDKLKKIYGH